MEATMEHLGEESRMKDYTEFNDMCADQDPVTLVRAITRAHCWACGDEKLDEGHGEECDPPNMENGCTDECKLIVCPALPFDVEGGTVEVSNGGTYPSTATYACEGGDPPSDGDAERICQTDGTWSGTTPTACTVAPPGPFEGSTLMTADMQKQLADWMTELGFASAAGWERCYDSPNGDSKAAVSTFHAQCDAHERTLSVAHTEGNGGRTFGGYATKRWNAVTSTFDNSATGNFLFTLGSPAAAKYPPLTSYNQWDNTDYWPTWGNGACLTMATTGALGGNGYCNTNGGCPGLPDDFRGGDVGTWGATEMEVWYALA
jgi:hypothetical protein